MIVGVAYVENSTPRSRSNLSIDLISPIVPTWTRSSNGSPRLRNRRAQCSTSGRCRPTSASRAASRVPSGAPSSRSWLNSSALLRRVASTPPDASEYSSIVGSPAMSAGQVRAGGLLEGRAQREGDREPVIVGRCRGLGGKRGQHLPGEAVLVRRRGLLGRDPDLDGELAGPHEDLADE